MWSELEDKAQGAIELLELGGGQGPEALLELRSREREHLIRVNPAVPAQMKITRARVHQVGWPEVSAPGA